MKTTMNKEADKLTVKVEGRLDTLTVPEFDDEIKPALDGITELVLDLDALEYISSAGLRSLLGITQTMEKQGKMYVTNVSDEVMDIFDLTGFKSILEFK